jgi:HEPN domain-containing protein
MESHKQWLAKAISDLKASEKLLTDESVWDVAIYHTQQCAEKSLKAFLAWSQLPLEKTHNLVKLLELCIEIDSEFIILRNEAEILTPFLTAYRYPDVELIPEKLILEDAITKAKNVLKFVQSKIAA